MSEKNYADLIVWQKSMDFVEAVYRTTLPGGWNTSMRRGHRA